MKTHLMLAALTLAMTAGTLRAEKLEAPPNLKITDQEGRTFPLHDLKGTPLFVSFVYTRCPMPTMCPLTMKLTRQLTETLKKKNMTNRLNQLVVTLDPERDTPTELKDLAQRHRVDTRYVRFVTGQPDDLKAIQYAMLILAKKSGELVAHNIRSVLLDPELVPITDFEDNQWTAKKVIGALETWENRKPRQLATQ